MKPEIQRTAIAGLVTTLVMGCASPPVYINLLHPEYGKGHFDRDWSECQRENTQTAVDVNPSGDSVAPQTNDDLARNCMAARGWSQTTEPKKPVSARQTFLGMVTLLLHLIGNVAVSFFASDAARR